MTRFVFGNKSIDLPADAVRPSAPSRDATAWQTGHYTTVRLFHPIRGLRVHTSGRSYPDRPPSNAEGSWILIGDVIQTSTQIAYSRSLPGKLPQSMVAFTHVSEVSLAPGTVLNIGLASAKFSGEIGGGGGFQAEHVSGRSPQFRVLGGNYWHGKPGAA
jgi:hypothetical protein